MHHISIDRAKNRLYIKLSELTREEMSDVSSAIENACQNLIPGFTCVTLFEKARIITNQDEDMIYMAQEIVFRYGISKVVRVIHKGSVIGKRQLERLSAHADYRVEYADSLEDAEKLLDDFSYEGGRG